WQLFYRTRQVGDTFTDPSTRSREEVAFSEVPGHWDRLTSGAAARFRDSWLGSLVGGLAHDDLELDRGQSCESGLASATVVGPFDPGHDRDPQLLSGGPSLPVQDVALKQAEEALHGGVVTG